MAERQDDSTNKDAPLEHSLARLVRAEFDLLLTLGGRTPDREKMAGLRQRVLVAEIGRRRDSGYSSSHLARVLGVSRATIYRWQRDEQGKSDD
jgi:DNA-binding XRE family transcriptional regulator